MSVDQSLWGYFWAASPIVKFVMLLLIVASIWSWALIFQRGKILRETKRALFHFDENFWSGQNLDQLYQRLEHKQQKSGIEEIFLAGFQEYQRTNMQQSMRYKDDEELTSVARAMRTTCAREIDQLETALPFLATVGSTSPYVGLFGTVWGIMTAFHSLGSVQQATIAMVAPGISEALIATALGLFAAIPAVVAYNRYNAKVERIIHQYETFQEEFISLLARLHQPNQENGHEA